MKTKMLPLLVAAFVGATGIASAQATTESLYGLSKEQVSDTMTCAGSAGYDMVMFEFFHSGEPIDKTLPMATSMSKDVMPPAEVEQRLRAVYAAKPANVTEWSRNRFAQCLAQAQVPIEAARARRCYQHTFFLAARVPMAKARGLTREQYVAGFDLAGMDPANRANFDRLITLLWDRDPNATPENHLQDIAFFLKCATVPPAQR